MTVTGQLPLCRVPGCVNHVGGPGTKCGSLCYEHWSKRSSSSLRKTIDDPEAYGGGPEPGDPSEDQIADMTSEIRSTKRTRGSSGDEEYMPRIHRLHLPDGYTYRDFEDDTL